MIKKIHTRFYKTIFLFAILSSFLLTGCSTTPPTAGTPEINLDTPTFKAISSIIQDVTVSLSFLLVGDKEGDSFIECDVVFDTDTTLNGTCGELKFGTYSYWLKYKYDGVVIGEVFEFIDFNEDTSVISISTEMLETNMDDDDDGTSNLDEVLAGCDPEDNQPCVDDAPNLINIKNEDSRITLNWDSSSEIISYKIYLSISPGVNKVNYEVMLTCSNASTCWFDNDTLASLNIDYQLIDDATYYFVITAIDGNDEESGISNELSVVWKQADCDPLNDSSCSTDNTPNLINVINENSRITLSYDGSPDATSYKIYMSIFPNISKDNYEKRLVCNMSSTCWIGNDFLAEEDYLLIDGATYYFVITSIDSNDEESGISNELSVVWHDESFDEYTNAWESKTSIPAARDAVSVEKVGGKIYVIGGEDGQESYFDSVYEYDPHTDSWTTKTSMPSSRSRAAHGVIDGKIYVIGGITDTTDSAYDYSYNAITFDIYDPVEDIWNSINTGSAAIYSNREFSTNVVVDDKLYIIGGNGYDSFDSEGGPLASVIEFSLSENVAGGIWTKKAAMPTPRYGTASSLVDGNIYVIGGSNYDEVFNTVEMYNPATNTWTTKASMIYPRFDPTSAVVDGKIYIIGGASSDYDYYDSVEVYDPATNTWTEKSSLMLTPRNGLGSIVFGNVIYAIGGWNGSFVDALDIYRPLLDDDILCSSCNIVLPAKPANLTATAGDGSITLNWSSVVDADYYNIYWSTSSGVSETLHDGSFSTTDTTYTYSELTNGTTYYCAVTAVNSDGTSEAVYANATPQQPDIINSPVAPTGLTATPGDEEITLFWNIVSDATSYNIYWSTSSGVSKTSKQGMFSSESTSYTHSTLTSSTIYYYVVTAKNTTGESDISIEANAVTKMASSDFPTNFTATAGSSEVALTWDAVTGADSYNIYWSTTSSGVSKTINEGVLSSPSTSYTHSGLTNDTVYYYVVTAVNSTAESNESNMVIVPFGDVIGDFKTLTGTISISGEQDKLTFNGN